MPMPCRRGRRFRLVWLSLPALLMATAVVADPVLYRKPVKFINDGKSGRIIELQRAINSALAGCGRTLRIGEDGIFGNDSRKAIRELASCPSVAAALPAGSPAFEGAATVGFWRAVVATPVPTMRERVRAILLTFEGTDYTNAEWNYCQNRPFYEPPAQPVCFSNDRASYLTWGPNGATAGHGREVQAILAVVNARDNALIGEAFGTEAGAVTKLVGVSAGEVERYLCHVWTVPARRDAWVSGFRRLGGARLAQDVYDEVYASARFDGGKIKRFFNAWKRAGLEPTEVDFAFFVDRSAHMSIREQQMLDALMDAGAAQLAPWAARRAVTLTVLPGNADQRRSRLGRDVTFYIDGATGAGVRLSAEEDDAWRACSGLRAADLGLTDDNAAPAFEPGPPIDWEPDTPVRLTTAELACPAAVLDPRSPGGH